MWLIKVLITICASVLISSSQLPYMMVPENYKLEIKLDEGFEKSRNFSGIVEISMRFEGVNTTNIFSLDAKNLIIDEGNIRLSNSTTNFTFVFSQVVDDVLVIVTDEELWMGNYTLEITYTGFLKGDSTRGFYLSTYTDDEGSTKYIAVTNFGQIDARRVFPCFDQPEFTATFDVGITYPENYTALASTEESGATIKIDNLKRTTFKRTPEMPTHLLAFAVTEFACSSSNFGQTTIEICAKRGQENATVFAEGVVGRVLKTMKNYTGTSYEESGSNKLTLIAVPNFDIGGNSWGLILFSESDLLFDDNESSNYWKQKVVSALSYKLAHQWFARIVTLTWPSDKFVQQGLSTFFEYQIPDEFEDCQEWPCCVPVTCFRTSWHFPYQFSIKVIQTALLADSYNTGLPLSYGTDYQDHDASTSNDIFSNKGASIFRMMYNFLGPEKFTVWLTEYTKKSKATKASVDLLWDAYESIEERLNGSTVLPTNTSLKTVMQNWIEKPGYPLLHVSTDGKNVRITQEPFSINEIDEDIKWYVPITYYFEKKYMYNNTYYAATHATWITPDEELVINLEIEDDWELQQIIVDYSQSDYYRVSYDNTILSKLTADYKYTSFELVESHVIDDMFNLARAGKKTYKDVLDFMIFLKNDNHLSYYEWYSALNDFDYLLQRTNDIEIRNALKTYIKDLMAQIIENTTLQFEEKTHIQILRQTLIQTWACQLEDSYCVSFSRRKFNSYFIDNELIKPNLRSIVYCNGLRYSHNASRDFDFLWNKYLESTVVTEKLTILEALGCVEDASLRKEYLAKTLTADIKTHDSKIVFQSLSSNSREAVTEVLNFLYQNYSQIEKHFGDNSDTISNVVTNLGKFINTQDQIDLLVNFTLLENIGEGLNETIKATIDEATKNLETSLDIEKALKEYFNTDDDDDGDDDHNDGNKTTYQISNIVLVIAVYQILIGF